MAEAESEFTLGYRDALLLIPAIGTSIAVTYDVGYFWGMDIKFFSLFTLTEHLVFAMEALPLGLGAAAVVVLLIVMTPWAIEYGRRKGRRTIEKIESKEWTFEDEDRRNIRRDIVASFFAACFFIYGLYLFATGVFGTGTFVMCFGLGFGLLVTAGKMFEAFPVMHTYFLVSCLLVTFATGAQIQRNDRLEAINVHKLILNDGELTGRIVRSGERGLILAQAAEQRNVFVKWDEVRRIEAQQTVSKFKTP